MHNFNFELGFSKHQDKSYYDKIFDENSNLNISTKSKERSFSHRSRKITKKISLLINFAKNNQLPVVLKKITENFLHKGIQVESDNLLKKRNYFDNTKMNIAPPVNLELNPDTICMQSKKDNSLKSVFLNNIENKRRKYFKQTLLKSLNLDDGVLTQLQRGFVENYRECVQEENEYQFLTKCFLLKIPFSKKVYDQITFSLKTKLVVFFYAKYINMDQFKNLFKTNIESFFYIRTDGKKKQRYLGN